MVEDSGPESVFGRIVFMLEKAEIAHAARYDLDHTQACRPIPMTEITVYTL